METFFAVILAGAVIAFVGYPLFKPQTVEAYPSEPEETHLDEAITQKESTLSAIAELDFDHAMGNLSDRDYLDLRDKYKLKALALLKREDEIAPVAAPATEESAPEVISAVNPRGCGSCGALIDPGDKFCSSCGTTIGDGCPGCGSEYTAGAAFCAHCGHRLASRSRKGKG